MMDSFFRVITWNANGLIQRRGELENFLHNEKIDVALISETHLTSNAQLKVRNFDMYHCPHPCGQARGGSAILINSRIKHHVLQNYQTERAQITSVQVQFGCKDITFSAIYSPPRSTLREEDYTEILNFHKGSLVLGGDFNAKNTVFGS